MTNLQFLWIFFLNLILIFLFEPGYFIILIFSIQNLIIIFHFYSFSTLLRVSGSMEFEDRRAAELLEPHLAQGPNAGMGIGGSVLEATSLDVYAMTGQDVR